MSYDLTLADCHEATTLRKSLEYVLARNRLDDVDRGVVLSVLGRLEATEQRLRNELYTHPDKPLRG